MCIVHVNYRHMIVLLTQPRFHASMFRTISINDVAAASVIRDTKENDAKLEVTFILLFSHISFLLFSFLSFLF